MACRSVDRQRSRNKQLYNSRSFVAASNGGSSPSSEFPKCPRPQLPAPHSNSSQRLNRSSPLTHSPTNNSPVYNISARTTQKTPFLCSYAIVAFVSVGLPMSSIPSHCLATAVLYLLISRSLPSNRTTCNNILQNGYLTLIIILPKWQGLGARPIPKLTKLFHLFLGRHQSRLPAEL
jgi:hypothetical protein